MSADARMGNCQAADLGSAVVEFPQGKVRRIPELQRKPVLAQRLMANHPGYFVALVSSSIVKATSSCSSYPVSEAFNRLPYKLLAPDAPLRMGHRYRLISFEEALHCFSQVDGKYASHGRPTMQGNATRRAVDKKRNTRARKPRAMTNHIVEIGC
ncbi:hypothetical protein KP509_24G013100 [Ceratopteris richardii]|uniref:Uncharacterized protein n=1 Tax=Ceratopteris richardii TaxID=49495 RepID=A0A8T2RVD4_CERRI|nr:hypothetical protein KP509_24G013100 [Ceratopteris richardii]